MPTPLKSPIISDGPWESPGGVSASKSRPDGNLCLSMRSAISLRAALVAESFLTPQKGGCVDANDTTLHHVGEGSLQPAEVEQAADQQKHDGCGRDGQHRSRRLAAQHRPAEALDHPGHR